MHEHEAHYLPRAIIHIDGDAFFVACEVAGNPSLKGKPVITGKDKGIASAMSYEAKARGVTRAMRLSDIRAICPDIIMLPSRFDLYELYSRRMVSIVRRFTSIVEEYSIDECFADITGLDEKLGLSYEAIARMIKDTLSRELGMTFSVGLSINKVLAKTASKHSKPDGFTVITPANKESYLKSTPIGRIWGIGRASAMGLQKAGIRTAYDLATKDPLWMSSTLAKPQREIYQELNGHLILPIDTHAHQEHGSFSCTRTHTPPTQDKEYLFSELSRNVESVCARLRSHHIVTEKISFFLKTQGFAYQRDELKLTAPTANPIEILRAIRPVFDTLYEPYTLYRATGITCSNLASANAPRLALFHERRSEKIIGAYAAIDAIDKNHGDHTIFLGSSMRALQSRGEGTTPSHIAGLPILGQVS
jgi:nucleotidyltransferase/DNA polymerase involved in DNA repair